MEGIPLAIGHLEVLAMPTLPPIPHRLHGTCSESEREYLANFINIRLFTLQLGTSELYCAAERPCSAARVWPSGAVHSDREPVRTRLGLECRHAKERAPYRPSIALSRRAAWWCTVERGFWPLQAFSVVCFI